MGRRKKHVLLPAATPRISSASKPKSSLPK